MRMRVGPKTNDLSFPYIIRQERIKILIVILTEVRTNKVKIKFKSKKAPGFDLITNLINASVRGTYYGF